ncbi:hypothetical protein [Primorskyibacter sp. 2E233]|uniref:hypothetical protein n=1 Tax=Primorskyibacter sp. 2E233 TaxID=3413431 RepID=UPI003BF06B62
MPIRFSIHPDRRLAFFRFEGEVDTSDCANVFEDYISAKGFSPDLVMLSDTSSLVSINSDYSSILSRLLELRKSLKVFQRPILSVIYARSDAIYGMARLLEQVQNPISNIKIIVCRDQSEALRLAGQPYTSMQALNDAIESGTN